MYNVLIVDDEAIIRTSISLLVEWENEGFKIIGDASNGKQALELMEKHHIDIVITDIKMPVMDGIELIKEMNRRSLEVGVIVLSGYNDFPLVRQTFKLGVQDYLLKSDISSESLLECVTHVASTMENTLGTSIHKPLVEEVQPNKAEVLRQLALGIEHKETKSLFACSYRLACFEIDDFAHEIIRFGKDLKAALEEPMINFANQIPRVLNKCIFCSISHSRYVLFYPLESEMSVESHQQNLISICGQVISVWKNYMNISVSVGISSQVQGEENFTIGFEEALSNISMKFIFGRGRIHTPENYPVFNPKEAIKKADRYKGLIDSIRDGFSTEVIATHQKLFTSFYSLRREEIVLEGLYMIYHIAAMLRENNDEIWAVFNTDTNFYQKLNRLESTKQIEMWLINFIRWIVDYMEHNYARKQEDLIERAKRFIYDNYSNPTMSLGAVASYIGFNEKYFSTWFTKEIGMSFSSYFTELRIKKAKELMDQTDMKIYEISENVGYKNVEHFNRVFKKMIGLSPTKYKRG